MRVGGQENDEQFTKTKVPPQHVQHRLRELCEIRVVAADLKVEGGQVGEGEEWEKCDGCEGVCEARGREHDVQGECEGAGVEIRVHLAEEGVGMRFAIACLSSKVRVGVGLVRKSENARRRTFPAMRAYERVHVRIREMAGNVRSAVRSSPFTATPKETLLAAYCHKAVINSQRRSENVCL